MKNVREIKQAINHTLGDNEIDLSEPLGQFLSELNHAGFDVTIRITEADSSPGRISYFGSVAMKDVK